MTKDTLAQRRNWFRYFPEGTLEFLVITRVLAVLLLIALMIVTATQKNMVLIALSVLAWADYLLVSWWLVQMTTDLDDLLQEPDPQDPNAHRRPVTTTVLSALPSCAAFLILAPWAQVFFGSGGSRETITRVLIPVFFLTFLVLSAFAQRELKRIKLGPPIWTLLFLIPGLHWLALHRLVGGLHERLRQRGGQEGESTEKQKIGGGMEILVADVTWVMAVLPWFIVVCLSVVKTDSGDATAQNIGMLCGTFMVIVFVIADLAAMETLQQRFIRQLHDS